MNRLLFLIVFFISWTLMAQEKTVTGIVTDESGAPIPGVSVVVKGTSKGISTGFGGEYSLDKIKSTDVLVFSSIGFQTKEVRVGNSTKLNVQLLEDTQQLGEVVVTAFGGTQKKASIVGSIQTVNPSELKIPSANLSAGFAGRMAGIISFQRSGQPGADGADFYIRGVSTLHGVSSPLIILDGVEVSKGDLNALAPEVIESFSILKDATATALYGTRGANGVMIISTKSGANLEKPIINVRVEGTMSQPTSIPKMVDGATYMRMYNEAADNLSSGVTPFSQEQIDGTANNLNPYVYPNVNWYNEMFKNQAYGQKVNFNIRGGGKKLDYFMSITANHDDGMLKGISKDFFSFDNNISVKKYAFQNNINAKLTDDSRISLRLNAQLNDSRTPNYDNINDIFGNIIKIPNTEMPIMFPGDDITNHVKWGVSKEAYVKSNPIAELVSEYRDSFNSTVIANVEYEQKLGKLIEGLKFNGLVSFKNYSATQIKRRAPYNKYVLSSYTKNLDGTFTLNPERTSTNAENVVLTSDATTGGDRRFYVQGMLDYSNTFNKVHAVNAMVVYSQDELSRNNLKPNNDTPSFDILVNSLPNRKQSLAGRLSYVYDSRYMIEVNAGYNGSENFAKGNRWGFFPSVAVGYNISEEPFFESLKDVVQVFKIRNSWGLVGNDQIGGTRFLYMPRIVLNHGDRSYRTGIDQNYNLNGPKYERYPNNELTWEVGEKLNLGIDLTLFNSLDIHFDAFREHRRNIFQERSTIPKYLGSEGTRVYANSGEVLNKGIDFSVDYNKQINDNFSVSVKGTFTYAYNRIIKFDEPATPYPNLSRIGRSLNVYSLYQAEGLFIDEAEIRNRPEQKISSNVAPGDIKYKDMPDENGKTDNQIDANDKAYLGYPTVPEIVYGVGGTVVYKNWDFGIFFQGVGNTSLVMYGMHPFGTQTNRNLLQWIADSHWSKENQNIHAEYPRLTKTDHPNNTEHSSFWLRDASFLKLKSLELGYTYKNARVFISGTNLLTFSKFKLWDPEQGDGAGLKYPTQRTISVGFQMSFNNKK